MRARGYLHRGFAGACARACAGWLGVAWLRGAGIRSADVVAHALAGPDMQPGGFVLFRAHMGLKSHSVGELWAGYPVLGTGRMVLVRAAWRFVRLCVVSA